MVSADKQRSSFRKLMTGVVAAIFTAPDRTSERGMSTTPSLVAEWPLPPSATLGSSLRLKGIEREIRARLPWAARKFVKAETGRIVDGPHCIAYCANRRGCVPGRLGNHLQDIGGDRSTARASARGRRHSHDLLPRTSQMAQGWPPEKHWYADRQDARAIQGRHLPCLRSTAHRGHS